MVGEGKTVMSALGTARTLLWSLVLGTAFLAHPAVAEQVTKEGEKGDVTVTTTIKRDGEACETGATDECKVGEPCFTNIQITGEPARQLYLLHWASWLSQLLQLSPPRPTNGLNSCNAHLPHA
jgi:hypothetical protein